MPSHARRGGCCIGNVAGSSGSSASFGSASAKRQGRLATSTRDPAGGPPPALFVGVSGSPSGRISHWRRHHAGRSGASGSVVNLTTSHRPASRAAMAIRRRAKGAGRAARGDPGEHLWNIRSTLDSIEGALPAISTGCRTWWLSAQAGFALVSIGPARWLKAASAKIFLKWLVDENINNRPA